MMPSAIQRSWNGDRKPVDDNAIVISKKVAPAESWWICDRQTFKARWQRELPRIVGSAMAKTVPNIQLGGKLP